jgi:hypothetical protein
VRTVAGKGESVFEGCFALGQRLAADLRHPVMLTGLAVILLTPLGLLTARLADFSPTTQMSTALEAIAANLCWIPPLVGWLADRRRSSPAREQ